MRTHHGIKMSSKTCETAQSSENNGFYDPMAVTWTEKYSSQIEAVWNKLPGFVARFTATLAILLLCSTLKGKGYRG